MQTTKQEPQIEIIEVFGRVQVLIIRPNGDVTFVLDGNYHIRLTMGIEKIPGVRRHFLPGTLIRFDSVTQDIESIPE